MLRKGRIPVTDVNPHLLCVLCGGYFVDATTIIECLHSYCRTCIVRYLETSKMCPLCDVLVHKTKPLENLRADKTLQDLVYKLVPGLFESEMANRRKFYAEHPEECEDASLEDRGEACMEKSEEVEEEKVSLALELSANGQPPSSPKAKITDKRYLLCPSGVTVGHLKKFITVKFSVPSKFQIQFYHSRVELSNNLSLHDISNLYTWRRTEPLRLFYVICQSPPKTADVITTPEGRRRRISECKARQERKLANLLDFTASESPIKIGSARSPKYFDDSDTDNAITDKCTMIRDVNENCVKRNNSDSDSSVDERPRIRWKDSPRSKKSGIFIKPRTPLNGKHKQSRFSDHFVKPKLTKLDIYSKSSRKGKHNDSQLLNDTKIVDSMKLLKIDKTCTKVLSSVKNERKGDIFDFREDTSVRPKVVSLPKRPKERKNYTLIRPGSNIKTNDVKLKLCTDPNDFKVEFNMHMPNNRLNDVILKSVLSKTKCDPEKTLIVKQEKSSHLDKLPKNCDSLKANISNTPDSNKSPKALKNNRMDDQSKGASVNSPNASTNTNSVKKFKIWKPHLTDEELEIEKKFTTNTADVEKPKTTFSDIPTDSPHKILKSAQISTKTKPPSKIILEKTPVPNGINTLLSYDARAVKNNQIPVVNSNNTRLQQTQLSSASQNKFCNSLTSNSKTVKSSVTKQSNTPAKQTIASKKGRKKTTPKTEKTKSTQGTSVKQKTATPKQISKQNDKKSFPANQSGSNAENSKSQPQNLKHANISNEDVNKSNKVLPLLQTTATIASQSALTTSPRKDSDIPLSQISFSSPLSKPEHRKRLDNEDAVMGLLELSKVTKLSEPVTPSGKQTEMSWLNPKRNTLIQNKSSSPDTKPVEKKLDFKNWEYLKQKCSKIKTKSLSTSSSKDISEDAKKAESTGKQVSDVLKSDTSPKSTKSINVEASETKSQKQNEEKSDFGRIKTNDQSDEVIQMKDIEKTANERFENSQNDQGAKVESAGQLPEKNEIEKIQINSHDVNCGIKSKGINNDKTVSENNKDAIVCDKSDSKVTKTNMTDVTKTQSHAVKTVTVQADSESSGTVTGSVSGDSKKSKLTEHKENNAAVVKPAGAIKPNDKSREIGQPVDIKDPEEKAVNKINRKIAKVETKSDKTKNTILKIQTPEKKQKIQPVVAEDIKSTDNSKDDKVMKNENIVKNSIKINNSSDKVIDIKIIDDKKIDSGIMPYDEKKIDANVSKKDEKSEGCPLDRELQICVSTEQNIYNNTAPVPSILSNISKRNGDIDNFSVRTKKQKAIDVIVKQINERNDSKMKNSGSGSVSSLSPNSGSISSLSPTSPTSPLSPVFRNEKRGEIVMRTKKDEVRKIMNSYKNSENSVASPVALQSPNRALIQNQSEKKRPAEKCEMNIPKKRKLDSSIINEIENSGKKEEEKTPNISCESNSSKVQDNNFKNHNSVTDTSNHEHSLKVNSNNQDKRGNSALGEANSVNRSDAKVGVGSSKP